MDWIDSFVMNKNWRQYIPFFAIDGRISDERNVSVEWNNPQLDLGY